MAILAILGPLAPDFAKFCLNFATKQLCSHLRLELVIKHPVCCREPLTDSRICVFTMFRCLSRAREPSDMS